MLVGGNWKCNGTLEEVAKWCKMFNEGGPIPISTEVFAAPAACHIGYVTANLRPDIAVSAQNCGVECAGANSDVICESTPAVQQGVIFQAFNALANPGLAGRLCE